MMRQITGGDPRRATVQHLDRAVQDFATGATTAAVA
jgi:hypothetical protein